MSPAQRTFARNTPDSTPAAVGRHGPVPARPARRAGWGPWAPAAAALGFLFLGPATPATAPFAHLAAQQSTLDVNGTGEVEVTPDRARISFAVETEAETAGGAGEANARLMDQVVSALRDTGIEPLRIESMGYHLEPRYRIVGDERLREIAGYTARNTLQVIVDDVDAVGRLVDTALGAGANRVAGLSFEIQDSEPHRMEALERAVSRARSEAEVMARALGMRLGEPTRVQGGAERPGPRAVPMMARMEVMADAPTTPVEAGLQRVTASVSITYRLHPDG